MKDENLKKKNFNAFLYLRIDKDDKKKCEEIAKYYGMPNVSTYFRELIKKQIELYENKGVK